MVQQHPNVSYLPNHESQQFRVMQATTAVPPICTGHVDSKYMQMNSDFYCRKQKQVVKTSFDGLPFDTLCNDIHGYANAFKQKGMNNRLDKTTTKVRRWAQATESLDGRRY